MPAQWLQSLLCITLFCLLLPALVYCEPLTCYSCVTTDEDSDCANNATLVNTTICEPHHKYCTVVSMNGIALKPIFKVTRECSDRCVYAGCGVFGDEDGEDHMLCRSCCMEDYCNTDGGSTAIHTSVALLFLTYITVQITHNFT